MSEGEASEHANGGMPFEDAVLGDFEKYYGTGDAARVFGVHPQTLARWRKEGRIYAIRTPGGWWRYSHTEIQRLWEKMNDGKTFALPPEWRGDK